ncbi:DUF4232 domain-containing protein [Kitasatospora sp. NPDC056138]|uniref:DUF4232 domain-containing protein n=1 Tax=Kitasatospora sp. NPDC056138 TaxID=3345724 RepID=UPI0035D95260
MTVSVSALLAGLGLTACSSSSGSTPNPPKAGGAAPVSAAPVAGQSAVPVPAAPIVGRSAAPVSAASAAGITAATGSDSSQASKCSTQNLKWTLTRITDPGTGAKNPANGELIAVNSGSHSCILAGYPKLEFHLGKGPEADGVGNGNPAPVTLGAGKKAVIALRYSEFNGKGPDSDNCVFVTASSADVAAPGDSTGVRVPVTDQNGKPAEITICGDEVRMSPPVAR